MSTKTFLLKSTTLAICLAIAIMLLTSLLITHNYNKVEQVGSPGSDCTICGAYNVYVKDRGWPAPITESIQPADSASAGYPYSSSGLYGPGIIVDFVVWFWVAELITLPLMFVYDRRI